MHYVSSDQLLVQRVGGWWWWWWWSGISSEGIGLELVAVKLADHNRKEAVVEPVLHSPDAHPSPISLARWGEQGVAEVVGVYCDGDVRPAAALVVEILDGWELHTDDLLRRFHPPLDGTPVVGRGAATPGCEASSQDALHDAVAEVHKRLCAQAPSPQAPQKVEALCLL